MTREEQLKFCNICRNQAFDLKRGIYCSLTGEVANFETYCSSFVRDTSRPEADIFIPLEGEAASTFTRFVNFLLDSMIASLYSFFFGYVLGLVLSGTSRAGLEVLGTSTVAQWLVGLCSVFSYYLITEGLWGKSPAKFFTRTRVVNAAGEKPSWRAILLRSACRLIPLDPFSYFGGRGNGWHDTLSGTQVVKEGIL